MIGLMLLAVTIGIAATLASRGKYSRAIASAFSLMALSIALAMLYFAVASGSANSTELYSSYISSFNISLEFRTTAISLALLLMATIVSFVTLLSGNAERDREKTASSLVLLFELAAIGLFTSANFFLFFIFWDIGVVALFFMIYLLGSANRRSAAMKFLVYEVLASLLLLLGIMVIYFYTPVNSFDIATIIANASLMPMGMQALVFVLLFLAFMINMPIFPLHLWLPDAHTEASTQGSMLLSGILTKFGGYGMLLLFSMLPIAGSYSVPIGILAGFSAFYVTFVLMTQHDIKRVIAYTTIVEMSIILFGIATLNSIGIVGATYAMLAHGLTIALLFLVAGSVSYVFRERDIRTLKGVVRNSISTAYTFLTGVFATTGVPLTAAFVGDILIFSGAIRSFGLYGIVPLFALVLMGGFLYFVANKSFMSTVEYTGEAEALGKSQKAGYALLIISIFAFGVLPFFILNLLNVSV